jgi:hypothetical protein
MACPRFGSALIGSLLLAASASAQTGPDIIVGDIPFVTRWGVVGELRGYSIATTACNVGDLDANWYGGTNQHPVIAQNLYRLYNGRLEQLGQSWVKHGYTTFAEDLCGSTCNGHEGTVLGAGCSDPYAGFTNGHQPLLGPRSEVNPVTGDFPYPYGLGWQQQGDQIYKRIQVREADLFTPGAIYFAEAQYVAADDAAWGNSANNNSYRRVTFNPDFSGTPLGETEREKPAIHAWKDHGLGVDAPDPDVFVAPTDVPDDGRFWIGYKVSELGGGWWRYEYAVENLTSDLCGGSVEVPIKVGTDVSGTGFHGVASHSGEPYDNTPWTMPARSNAVRWESPETYDENPNSNALRWGTLYNFYFDADVPPRSGTLTLGLFKPSPTPTIPFAALVPGDDCPADLDGDGVVNLGDLALLLGGYGATSGATPEQGDLNGDGDVDLEDLSTLLSVFGDACP